MERICNQPGIHLPAAGIEGGPDIVIHLIRNTRFRFHPGTEHAKALSELTAAAQLWTFFQKNNCLSSLSCLCCCNHACGTSADNGHVAGFFCQSVEPDLLHVIFRMDDAKPAGLGTGTAGDTL